MLASRPLPVFKQPHELGNFLKLSLGIVTKNMQQNEHGPQSLNYLLSSTFQRNLLTSVLELKGT